MHSYRTVEAEEVFHGCLNEFATGWNRRIAIGIRNNDAARTIHNASIE